MVFYRFGLISVAIGLVLLATGTARAQLTGPFAGLDVSKLALHTPGVTVDRKLSTDAALYLNVDGMKYGGFVRLAKATSGQTIDGDWLLAIPLETGGDAGAYTALVYRSTGAAPDFVGTVDSKNGLLEVAVHDGHLFVTAPLYGRHDLPCCPSAKVVERMLYSPGIDGLIVVTTHKVDLTKPKPTPSPAR
jgi:hypothetical protein